MIADSDLLLARRELALERRLQSLQRDNALHFFVPHEKQYLFFAEGAKYHYRYARTGNRFGKSIMGCAEDIAYAIGYRPWMEQRFPVINGRGEVVHMHEGYRGHPLATLGIPPHPTKGTIITTDWDKSKEVFTEQEPPQLGKLFAYIPKDSLGQPTRNHSGAIDRIPVKHRSGGWSIIRLDTVKSYKQNPLGSESGDNDWVHGDEPFPEGQWKANARGLVDRGGHAWFTCTPISEPWIDAAFIPDLQDQTEADLGTVVLPETSRWMVTGEMDDNPYNTKEYIELYMSWLTDEEKEARRKGVPLAYSGLVFKEFNWNEHVWQGTPPWPGWFPPEDYCIYIAVDYHFRKNDAILFIAVSPQEHIYVFAEIWEQLLVKDEVKRIRQVLRGRPYQPVLMEPLASTPNKITELTPMDEYRREGLAVIPATKDPVNGIRSVKALLKARDRRGDAVVHINPACRRFLFEIARGFIWDGEENKPLKKNDDMMEDFHRLALQGLTYIEPSTDNDYLPNKAVDIDSTSFYPFEFNEPEPAKRKFDRSRRYRSNVRSIKMELTRNAR